MLGLKFLELFCTFYERFEGFCTLNIMGKGTSHLFFGTADCRAENNLADSDFFYLCTIAVLSTMKVRSDRRSEFSIYAIGN